MRIISLALRQRIFGSIRTAGNCTLWCGDPKDALIFRGKKHEVHEIAFYLFSQVPKEIVVDGVDPCPLVGKKCISPNHLHGIVKDRMCCFPWERMKTGREDRKDILRLHVVGVSKRTLKQWYMLETKELDDMLNGPRNEPYP